MLTYKSLHNSVCQCVPSVNVPLEGFTSLYLHASPPMLLLFIAAIAQLVKRVV